MYKGAVIQAQDIVVFAKLALLDDPSISSVALAGDIGLSQAQTYRALRRGEESRLLMVSGQRRGREPARRNVNRQGLYELFAYGVPYFFPGRLGRLERGIPTAASAPILSSHFAADAEPVVWPSPQGQTRGLSLAPLHPNVPGLVLADPDLYELLALIDAVRTGRARERNMARKMLKEKLL